MVGMAAGLLRTGSGIRAQMLWAIYLFALFFVAAALSPIVPNRRWSSHAAHRVTALRPVLRANAMPSAAILRPQGFPSIGRPSWGQRTRVGALPELPSPGLLTGAFGAVAMVAAGAAAFRMTNTGGLSIPFLTVGAPGTVRRRAALVTALMETTAGSNLGANATAEQSAEIEALAAQLEGLNPTRRPTAGPVNGDFALIYTTERSLHGFLAASPLGITPKDVGQRVSLVDGRVDNRIVLRGGIAIRAGGPLKVVDSKRIAYRFDKASISLGPLTVPIPLRAGGWSETTYLDADLRVVRNSRGDLQIMTPIR
jgi:hypothetical protein